MRIISTFVIITGISLCATACTKKDDGAPTTTTTAASATAAASGCGADYTDPQKEFCMKLPAGFAAAKPSEPDELYSENINYDATMDHFNVVVGFSSSNWKTFDDELASEEKWMTTAKGLVVVASGTTPGGGKWWTYTYEGYKSVLSLTKSNGNKAIKCSGDDGTPAVDACKSVRAYPK